MKRHHATMTALGTTAILTAAAMAAGAPEGAAAKNIAEAPSNALTPAEKAAGWTLLFDGASLDKWRGYRKEGFPEQGWTVDGGALKVSSGGGDIVTRDEYEDFELQLEWKASPGGNSGIMYLVSEEHDWPWQTGPEFQILDDPGAGMEGAESHSAGAIYDLYAPSTGKTLHPAGEWNHARIRLKDGVLQHWLNGEKVAQVDLDGEAWKQRIAESKFSGYEGFGVQPKGRIALQDHGNDIWFRNIKVRDLDKPMPNERALFNGEDMTGWSGFLAGDADPKETWSVRDGVLVCTGRPAGYIKTEDAYEDFVLKLDWRWDPETKQAGNSGVLLRMTGEDKVWPRSVEAQLMSGNAGDFYSIGEVPMKTDPERRNGRHTKRMRDAENPVGEWNHYEIIVDGGEVTLFINGAKVNHAWDVEEQAGVICLQSEGAPIHFRNIRLAPIR